MYEMADNPPPTVFGGVGPFPPFFFFYLINGGKREFSSCRARKGPNIFFPFYFQIVFNPNEKGVVVSRDT